MRRLIFATLIAAMLPCPAVAQDEREGDRNPSLPPELVRAYATSCGEEHEAVRVTPEVRATFHTDRGDYAELAFCYDQQGFAISPPMQSLDGALLVMSARVFEPFWGRAEQFWGSDLSLLRARMQQYDVTGAEDMYASVIRSGGTREVVAGATIMSRLGQFEEAIALLDAAETNLFEPRRLRRSSLDFDRNYVALTRAGLLKNTQGPLAALASLDRHAAMLQGTDDFSINLSINRAAYMADGGLWEQSLQLIEPAYRQFRGTDLTPGRYNIGGSDREFSWIIACDLIRLGREAEAARYLEVVETADEIPPDAYLAQTKRSTDIRLRLYRCTNDQAAWERVFMEPDYPLFAETWLVFQQRSLEESRPAPDWELSSELIDLFESRYRQLPASYARALAHWRGAITSDPAVHP